MTGHTLANKLLSQTIDNVDMSAELSDTELPVLVKDADIEWKEGSVRSKSESEKSQNAIFESLSPLPSSQAPSSCSSSSALGFFSDNDKMDIYSDGKCQVLEKLEGFKDPKLGPSTAKPKAALAICNGLSLMEEDPTSKPHGIF